MTCANTKHDKEGLPADLIEVSDRGGTGLAVYVQDQTTDMLDIPFLQEKATGLTLAIDTVIDERFITLSAGHGLTVGNSSGHIMELARPDHGHFYQGEIIDVVGDVIELSPPMSEIYEAVGTLVGTGNPNMCQDTATNAAIDGSVTPVIFSIKPLPTQAGDITRITMATTSPNVSDLTSFGGADTLSIGLTLRVKRPDGKFKNLYTYRRNYDVILHGFDSGTFEPRGGNAIHGFACRVSFAGQDKHGVTVRLDGALGEELQIVVSELMDNSGTGNLSVQFIAEGSELQG